MEQKVEREEVAKVTGTNKDDSVQNAPQKREKRRFIQTIRAHAEAERNINSAAEERNKTPRSD